MIAQCHSLYGRHLRRHGKPYIEYWDNATVKHNSLYTENGVLIPFSTYMVGRNDGDLFKLDLYAPPSTSIRPPQGNRLAGTFLWMGYFHNHFGHFLLSGLQRLWAVLEDGINYDFIAVPNQDYKNFLGKPFIRDILAGLGISESRIVYIPQDTYVERAIVPEPAFVETSHFYDKWPEFMQKLAIRLYSFGERKQLNGRPVYLSRSSLSKGTRVYRNEDLLCEYLSGHGFDIMNPETLSFQEQIELWRNRYTFVGFSGSAFLTSALTRQKNVIVLQHDSYMLTNQTMVDAASDNRSLYIDVSDFLCERRDDTRDFGQDYLISNPEKMAEAILKTFSYSVLKSTEKAEKIPFSLSENSSLWLGSSPIYSLGNREKPRTRKEDHEISNVELDGKFFCKIFCDAFGKIVIDIEEDIDITEIRYFNDFYKGLYSIDSKNYGVRDGCVAVCDGFSRSSSREEIMFRWRPQKASRISKIIIYEDPSFPYLRNRKIEIFSLPSIRV